jgi:RNA polymerase sigma-70 factor, ECF subfamily
MMTLARVSSGGIGSSGLNQGAVGALRPIARCLANHTETISWETLDEDLISAVAEGDRQAMQTLYTRHSLRIYRFVLRLTKDPALAEDLVSDVFLDIWRQADGFKAKSQVATWLLAIARNKALSALRRCSETPLDDQMAAAIVDPADDAETIVNNEDRSLLIRKCLSQLSAEHREVLDLVYYHEKSVDEAAEIVGAPANTVKTRMFYARKRMEKLLTMAGVGLNG